MSQHAIINDPPSPFVVEWAPRAAAASGWGDGHAAGRRAPAALDVAMGRGRHALVLARSGFRTFGVDRRLDAVREAVAHGREEGLVVRAFVADLTAAPLPRDAFDAVLVARYLQRDLFPSIRETVKAGGVVLYETFTVHQRRLGFGPTSADYLLAPNELPRHFEGFDVLFYEEVDWPEAVARLVARRPPP